MKTPAQIAAAIAAELRAHPERWIRFDAGYSGIQPDKPLCLVGHIQKQEREARYDLPTLQAFGRYVPEIASLRLGQELDASTVATEIYGWNDCVAGGVEDIIALCDRVAIDQQPEVVS